MAVLSYISTPRLKRLSARLERLPDIARPLTIKARLSIYNEIWRRNYEAELARRGFFFNDTSARA